ncbi:MAG TPA: pilin [Candidatus Paceibacterota bacterium]|nr:pilin [Candidatus Paceibacterota bacterium]
MRFIKVLLPVLVFGILALTPHQASAATATFFGPIIPPECHCETTAPDFGCVLQVIENLMNFAISIGVVIFVLVAAYAGLLWMFSPMNAHNREQGRTILLNAVVGLLITLCAWLIVDFVMKTLYNEGSYGPWNAILADGKECLVAITPPAGSTPSDGGLTTGAGTGPNDDKDADGKPNSTDDDDDNDLIKDQVDNCPFVANQNQADADNDGTGDACETATGAGLVPITAFNCKNANSCQTTAGRNSSLNQMASALGSAASQYQITETGVNTSVTHASGSNNLDMSCFGTCSSAQVLAAIAAWPGTVKYETNSQSDYNAKRNAGVPAANMLLLTGRFVNGQCSTGTGHCITAPHMSLNGGG